MSRQHKFHRMLYQQLICFLLRSLQHITIKHIILKSINKANWNKWNHRRRIFLENRNQSKPNSSKHCEIMIIRKSLSSQSDLSSHLKLSLLKDELLLELHLILHVFFHVFIHCVSDAHYTHKLNIFFPMIITIKCWNIIHHDEHVNLIGVGALVQYLDSNH